MLGRLVVNKAERFRFQSQRYFASSANSSGSTPGPCDNGSLHQFGDIFASVASRSLAAKILKIQNKLLKRKSLTGECVSGAVEESVLEIRRTGVDESRSSELSRLLRRCICCPDLKRFLRPDKQQTIEDMIGQDESIVPAGVDLELFSVSRKRNRVGPSISAIFEPAPSFQSINSNQFICYIYNLPLRVNEAAIRSALGTVGSPSEIFIYDTRGIPLATPPPRVKPAKPASVSSAKGWLRFASPINAIVTFDSEHEFAKATTLENRLFGIECRSTDTCIDGHRPMLIEPARNKTHLLLSGFPEKMVWCDFKSQFESLANGNLVLNEESRSKSPFNGSDMFEQRLDIHLPSFEVAHAILKQSRASPIHPSIVTAFSRFRTQWRDTEKQFVDSVYFEINTEF